MITIGRLKQISHSWKVYLVAATITLAAIIPALNFGTFFIYVLTLIIIFSIYAASWNLLAYSGQGSLGHAVFLGLGGFVSALVTIYFGVPPIIGLFVGAVFSAGVGFLIGLTCVRLKAWFLAMVTFGFSVIAVSLFNQLDPIMRGITGFQTRQLVPAGVPFYYLAVAFAVASVIAMFAILKSRMGLAFKAIRENETEAKMTGINAAKYKLLAFVISTFFAGLAGGLYAYFLRYIDNSIFLPANSFTPLIMCVIGGLGTIEGPIIGSLILVSLQQVLSLQNVSDSMQRTLGPLFPNLSNVGPPLSFLFIGVFLVIIVIFAPRGVTSIVNKVYRFLAKKPRKGEK